MKIEIWSDFVCPFCYIGKRRLEMALKQFPERDQVEIAYRSYELDPNASKNNKLNIHETLAKKYGMSIEQAKEANDNIGKQAAEIGLIYQFDTMIPTNTFDAHRLAKFAEEKSFGAKMTEHLLKAYFTDSKKISDYNTLADLAEDIGLNREETIEMLNSSAYSNAVRADEAEAKQIGISGVPFFVINQKYAVSGAQPVEAFVNALNMVWEEENGKTPLKVINPNKSKSEYCTDEGCVVSED